MKLVAIHCIHRNPTGRREASGELDGAGNMIFRAVSDVINPDTIFDLEDGEELDWLRGLGAVRDATRDELILGRAQEPNS